jgi:retron-type reverse transcriptase
MTLSTMLETGRYKISPYHCFTVNERGKERQIKSTKYKDRVVQKVLVDDVLYPRVVPSFIYDNGASQKEKGTDFALDRLREQLQEYVNKFGPDGYALIGDMEHYFDSLQHDMLNEAYAKDFKDERIMELIRHIHASIPGGVGVPLGNQLSQIDALMAASPIDHMVKEELRIRFYGRYMDDFYLIHQDKAYLKECQQRIATKAESLGLKLHDKKTQIVSLRHGFNFLGFHFYVTETGKVVQRLRTKSKVHMKQKLRKLKKKLDAGEVTMESINQTYDAWRAHAQRGDTYYLIRNMDSYFTKLFGRKPNQLQKKKRRKQNGKKT